MIDLANATPETYIAMMLNGMERDKAYTRRELAALVNLPVKTVHHWIGPLVAAGKLKRGPYRVCSISGQIAGTVMLP